MSGSVSRFNPQSHSFASKAPNGTWAPKPAGLGVVKVRQSDTPGPKVLGVKQTAQPAVKVL